MTKALSQKASIGQYLTRAPISLQKLEYIKSKGKVIIHTKYNEYFKENLKLLKAEEFISLLYEVDPLICPKCQSEMRVMSVITDRTEVIRILRHLFKIGRAPPGVELADLEGAG